LQHILGRAQATLHAIYDSLLSANWLLSAFEYGYATTTPKALLILWEAQFGDFVERRPGRDRPVHRQRRAPSGGASAVW
jgi:2-oxoglutarate dehydrogenase complex dehydrogenase (E1) component-like enzyme